MQAKRARPKGSIPTNSSNSALSHKTPETEHVGLAVKKIFRTACPLGRWVRGSPSIAAFAGSAGAVVTPLK